MGTYSLGLDFGTLSVRALLLDLQTGQEAGGCTAAYPHGVMETALPDGTPLPTGWALQDPADYLQCMEQVCRQVLVQTGVSAREIVGIGLDFTSSTVLAVDGDGRPLCQQARYAGEPHAYAKLWKHHGAEPEARQIMALAEERGEKWLPFYGSRVSSEWMLPKILETVHHGQQVHGDTSYYIEAMDWITWLLTGQLSRSTCAAGYKSFYRHDDGYPSQAFCAALHPELGQLCEKQLAGTLRPVGSCAGYLTPDMAQRLQLKPGIPVGTGIIDAHASVLGSGISEPGTMMIIVGTSSCHMGLTRTGNGIAGVPGIVKDGIIPGCYAYEAGQSCVGDLFGWFVDHGVPEAYAAEAKEKGWDLHRLLTDKLQGFVPGRSGLLALDWHNGVRSPLMDFDLNGLILGMNLQTKPEEIYLALMEATAFGTRMILEGFEAAGTGVDRILMSGGIPLKNPLLVQIYADVCNREIAVSASKNASVRGAALLGAAACGQYGDLERIVRKYAEPQSMVFRPDPDRVKVYDVLYEAYCRLHRYFGCGGNDVMKRLNRLREGKYFQP